MSLHAGQVLQERYRIDALLGRGGMGAVYRGTDLRFNAPVAIKENQMVTPESQKQFAREAGLLYRLHHPHLPRVIDHFFVSGQGQYLVMDYIEGEDLNQVLAHQGRISEGTALDWIEQVLDALEYLHSRNIIHRDVKPANVKITPDGRVYLVDFGLAKVHDPVQETTIGARGVTPGFAPPEQYGQGRTDARSDIYSAGATLYTLLTGTKPPDSLESMTEQAQLTPPRQLNPDVSPDVETAVLQATQVRATDRFRTAGEFRASLTRSSLMPQVARMQAQRALAPPRPARLPRWFLPVVGGIVGLLLVIIAGVLIGGGARRNDTDLPAATLLVTIQATPQAAAPTSREVGISLPSPSSAPTATFPVAVRSVTETSMLHTPI